MEGGGGGAVPAPDSPQRCADPRGHGRQRHAVSGERGREGGGSLWGVPVSLWGVPLCLWGPLYPYWGSLCPHWGPCVVSLLGFPVFLWGSPCPSEGLPCPYGGSLCPYEGPCVPTGGPVSLWEVPVSPLGSLCRVPIGVPCVHMGFPVSL